MLGEGNPRWEQLENGYRLACNPLALLRSICSAPASSEKWSSLWHELYHQGDVGSASYTACAYLFHKRMEGVRFDWNFYAFIAAVEAARYEGRNPDIPVWLTHEYDQIWQTIIPVCVSDMAADTDIKVLRAYLSVLAFAKGHQDLGRLLIKIDGGEIEAWLQDH